MTALREEQRAALLAELRANPGQTAAQLAPHVPVPPRDETVLTALFDIPPAQVPLTLVLSLLHELAGNYALVYSQPRPDGARWYPVPGPEER